VRAWLPPVMLVPDRVAHTTPLHLAVTCMTPLPCTAGCLRDLKEQTLLVWRAEGEDWEPTAESDDEEDVDGALATIDMRELGAISREAEARLGCSVEEAALQVPAPCAQLLGCT